MPWTCHCCLRELPDRAIENIAVTEEGDEVPVGSDCIKRIKEAGSDGYVHPNGDILLYTLSAYEQL